MVEVRDMQPDPQLAGQGAQYMEQAERVWAARYGYDDRIARLDHVMLQQRRANCSDDRVVHGDWVGWT
jgi:hypothetical protein